MPTCERAKTTHTLLAGLFIQTHNLLPFPGLHWPFHGAEMILQRQHKRELCGPSKCAFRAGGVRRSGRWKVGWGGEKLMEGAVVLGGGRSQNWWQGFGCFGTTVTLWHCGLAKIHTRTPRTEARWPHHLLNISKKVRPVFQACCYSNAGCRRESCQVKAAVSIKHGGLRTTTNSDLCLFVLQFFEQMMKNLLGKSVIFHFGFSFSLDTSGAGGRRTNFQLIFSALGKALIDKNVLE